MLLFHECGMLFFSFLIVECRTILREEHLDKDQQSLEGKTLI